ncbi:hypothetical protein HD554DRAFT_2036949 [Boletus coccyginus]|nr:hypothetical protein HD554DRAFT_2036949 [Boletus coccyginus]
MRCILTKAFRSRDHLSRVPLRTDDQPDVDNLAPPSIGHDHTDQSLPSSNPSTSPPPSFRDEDSWKELASYVHTLHVEDDVPDRVPYSMPSLGPSSGLQTATAREILPRASAAGGQGLTEPIDFMIDVPGTTKRAMRHLALVVEERLKLHEYGNYRPSLYLNELLLGVTPDGPECTVKFLTTHGPQQVKSVVKKEGRSGASVVNMREINDGLLKESQHLVRISAMSLRRMAFTAFTFSDGTFIPKGTTVALPSRRLHLDNERYDNAHTFDLVRSSNARDEEGEGSKYQLVRLACDTCHLGMVNTLVTSLQLMS